MLEDYKDQEFEPFKVQAANFLELKHHSDWIMEDLLAAEND